MELASDVSLRSSKHGGRLYHDPLWRQFSMNDVDSRTAGRPCAFGMLSGGSGPGCAAGKRPFEAAEHRGVDRSLPPHSSSRAGLMTYASIEENYLSFLEAKKDVAVHYSIKACSEPRILFIRIAALGVASTSPPCAGTETWCSETGIVPDKCIYSNNGEISGRYSRRFCQGSRLTFIADAEPRSSQAGRQCARIKACMCVCWSRIRSSAPAGREVRHDCRECTQRLLKLCAMVLAAKRTHFHVGTQCYMRGAWETSARKAAGIFSASLARKSR